MSELVGYNPDKEQKQKLVTLTKIASAQTENPNVVIYIPPIKGALPLDTTLDQFTAYGNDVWTVSIHQYGQSLSEYVASLQGEIKEKLADANTYVIGFSTGCALAADTGIAIGLPREHILLVAPSYPPRTILKIRAQAMAKRVKNAVGEKTTQPQSDDKLGLMRYIKRNLHLLIGKPLYANWRNLNQMGLVTKRQLETATVLTGEKDDVISPRTSHTDIFVPQAGHNFDQMAPSVIQHISGKG